MLAAYLTIMGIALAGVILLFVGPSGCPECGFSRPCPKCNARMAAVDRDLKRQGN